jgi:membrane fusion protein (multidrug efflux system)
MKKKMLVGTILMATLVISGIYKFSHRANMTDHNTVMVKASSVQETDLPQEIHVIGTLSAKSVVITPEIAGHVNTVLFKDGAAVTHGTVLVQLDDAVFKARYESSKAKLHYSENNFQRMALLGKKGVVAQQAIDKAESDLKERKAEVDENAVMVSKMKLIAPFDGVVGNSHVNPGDYVTVGQNIVMLTDTQHLRIEYNVPEKFLPHLKLGQEITITAAAYPGKIFTGTLTFISPTINADNRSLALYADIDNTENQLAAGMFVEASQSIGSTEHALVVPARSLVPVLDGAQVFKVVEGKAYSVNVIIGQRTAENVQVVQGLTKNDVVITDGQMKVKNGMTVEIQS